MKLLCLHGIGTNSDILEAQLVGVKKALSEHADLVFLDGEFDSEPAEEIKGLYPGPYYSYLEQPYHETIGDAWNMVDGFIAEEGPFDGIVGFSQGALVAASYMIQRAAQRPWEPAPFSIAVLICPVFPQSVADYLKESVKDPAPIEIPTACIYGSKDPWREQSQCLDIYLRKDSLIEYDHEGGHEIPRSQKVSEAIARAIEQCFERRASG